MHKSVRGVALSLLLASAVLLGSACDDTTPHEQQTTEDTTTAAPITESDTSDTTAQETSETTADTTTATETVTDMPEPVPEPEPEPEFVNPLTGLAAEKDFSTQRPAAIMINNIAVSCPQVGVSQADVIYECLVEGGYTRLMMLVMDYANLPEIGSIRSARDYYLDFAADYDALYVHAGGSPYAYDSIQARGITNLDGVNMYLPTTFYRDQDRVVSMGLEHSLMSTGEKIVEGIKYKRYRTALTQNFDYPLDFVKYGTTTSFEEAATHIHIPYSLFQITDFVYDAENEYYLRYQFDGQEHIDGATGEQLSFENVLIYFCETGLITGDPSFRIEVGTVGEGSGYYATRGTYIPITWKKESHESPIQFYDADGEPLLLNAGKTFISVCPTSIEKSIAFDYEW